MVKPVSSAHLLLAVRQKDRALVTELLRTDPNIASAVTDGGETALQIAAHQGDEELCRLLLGSGSGSTPKTIDIPTPVERLTPLHLAAARGQVQLVELLLLHNADTLAFDARGYTALHHAAWKGHAPVIRALCPSHVPVDFEASIKGETPLALAALLCREECVQLLLRRGADAELVNNEADRQYVEKVRKLSRKKEPPPKKTGLSTVLATEDPQGGGSFRGSSSRSINSLRIKTVTPVEVPPPGVPSPGASDDGASSTYSERSRRVTARSNAPSPIGMSVRKSQTRPVGSPMAHAHRPPGVVQMPQGSRRAHPMYKPPGSNANSSQRKPAEDSGEVELEELPMKGMPLEAGLLLDPATHLVFYQVPSQGGPLHRQTVSPLLVGKLQGGGFGGSKVVPVTLDDAPTLELSAATLRCLKRGNRAARWLNERSLVEADVAPEVGCKPVVAAVSLMVPLCAVLGVSEIAEIGQLKAEDFEACDIDVTLLGDIIAAWEGMGEGGEGPGGVGESKRPANQQQPSTPSMYQLLVEYGLVKLLPIAGEVGATLTIQRWHTLGPAAASVELSRFEASRLREMMARVKVLQDADLDQRADNMARLQRLSTGSVVLYEVMCRVPPPTDRGNLLLGVIIDDLGPDAEKRFKVRDLVDDGIVRAAAGQLTRSTPNKALAHLRSDLLPPLTNGAPVTPLTAVTGLPVQLAYDHWRDGDDSPDLEGVNKVVARNLVGFLEEPDDPDGLWWRVLWPDGEIRVHSTGGGSTFDLAHMQLHRYSGAPLLRTHVHALLGGAEAYCVPVVRSPLWSRPATDDTVPGAIGVAVLDASQTALQVQWSRSRSFVGHSPMYSPDGRGVYMLCHGIMNSQPVTLFTAKEGLTVEAGPGYLPEPGVVTGSGTMLYPTRLAKGGRAVVWEVRWEGGTVAEFTLGIDIPKAPLLLISANFMSDQQSDRPNILNEVTGLRQAGAQGGVSYTPAANMLGRSNFGKGAAALISGAAPLETQPLLVGQLVKINMLAMHLQPGSPGGPLAAYEPVPLSAQLKAKKEGRKLEPIQRDDVGMVVRDLGRGVYRGLMVRKLGSTDGWWYDETILLPATQGDVQKQIARMGPEYLMPRHLQGVVVTDANSAPGMLVQRAYRNRAALDGSTKAMMIGTLVSQPSSHTWRVQWPDGSSQTYLTGGNGRFQLCFAQTHWRAGAPLIAATTRPSDGSSQQSIAVVDGMHAIGGGMPPGTVRYVNDPPTQAALLQGEVAQMEPADMLATSFGERLFAGGMLQLYELSHAVIPGEWVTIFSAKRGLRVELHTSKRKKPAPSQTMADGSPVPEQEEGADGDGDEEAVTRARRPKGTLIQPVKLVSVKVKGGVTEDGARIPSHTVLDPKRVYWDVEWDDGTTGQYLIGIKEGDTSLQVLGSGAYLDTVPTMAPQLAEREHYLRFLESVTLLDSGNLTINSNLAEMVAPFHKAIQWHNQLLQELCNVWWSSAAVVAAAAGAGEAKGTFPLWRPNVELLGFQPDQLVLEVRKRDAPWLRWEPVEQVHEAQVGALISEMSDRRLAKALHDLIFKLGQVHAGDDAPSPGMHLTLSDDGSFLDPIFVLSPENKSTQAPASLAPLLAEFNSALEMARADIRGVSGTTGDGTNYTDLLDIGLNLEPSLGALSLAPVAQGGSPSPDITMSSTFDTAAAEGKARKHNAGSGLLAWLVQEITPDRMYIESKNYEKKKQDPGGEEEEKEEEAKEWMEEDRGEKGGDEGEKGGDEGDEKKLVAEKSEVDEEAVEISRIQNRSKDLVHVGPGAMLISGIESAAQDALLQLQRSLCALSCASALSSGDECTASRSIRLVGKAPCLWLEASELALVEGPLPKDPAVVRCRAAVNASIFNLWRLSGGLASGGGGSGDISRGLFETMRIVHVKAQAQIASESAQRSFKASTEASQSAADLMEMAQEVAGDIKPFAAEAVHHLLAKVKMALRRLHFAQQTADATTQYAATADLPKTYICEEEDIARAEAAAEAARVAVSLCQGNTRKAFPDMAHATMKAAKSVVLAMNRSFESGDELSQASNDAKALADEKGKAVESLATARNRAVSDVTDLRDRQFNKLKECQVLQSSMESSESEEDRQKYKIAMDGIMSEARGLGEEAQVAERVLLDAHNTAMRSVGEASEAAEAADRLLKEANLKQPEKGKYEGGDSKDEVFRENVTKLESLDSPVDQARSSVQAAEAALQTLDLLCANMPPALRSAEGAKRMLEALKASTAAVALRAAAEWSRTASLTFSEFKLNQEVEERKGARAVQQVKLAVKNEEDIRRYNSWREDWKSQVQQMPGGEMALGSLTGAEMLHGASGPPKAPPPAFKAFLPDGDVLHKMVVAGTQHLPDALRVYLKLRHKVDPSIKLDLEDTLIYKSLQATCSTLESIAKLAAESNRPPNLASSLALPEGSDPIPLEEYAVKYVALAIHQERKAIDANRALIAITEALAVDVKGEIVPLAVSKAINNAAKIGVNAAKGATQDAVRAIADQVKVLGPAATSSGLRAKALSRLVTFPELVETGNGVKEIVCRMEPTGELVQEAVLCMSQGQEEASVLLQALIPPPVEEKADGVEDDEPEAKPATQPKSAAQILEEERTIQAFIASVAVDVAKGAVSWGRRLMDPINAPGSLPKAVLPPYNGAEEEEDHRTDDEEHPTEDHMLRVIALMPKVLAAFDAALRVGGSHPGLLEEEDGVHDIMIAVTEASRCRANAYLSEFKAEAESDESAYRLYGPRSEAMLAAAQAVINGAEKTMDAAPLIMPPLKAERKLREGQDSLRKLQKAVGPLAAAARAVEEARQKEEDEMSAEAKADRKRTGCTLQLRLLLVPGHGSQVLERTSAMAIPGSSQQQVSADVVASEPWEVVIQFVPHTEEDGLNTHSWLDLTESDATLAVEQMCLKDVELTKMSEYGGTDFETNTAPAKAVLKRPALSALLRPYVILMSARNKVAAAAAAAEGKCPDPATLLSSSLLGSIEVPSYVVSSNMRQFNRWERSVTNISASSQLVLRGFIRARLMAIEDLAPIEVPADFEMP